MTTATHPPEPGREHGVLVGCPQEPSASDYNETRSGLGLCSLTSLCDSKFVEGLSTAGPSPTSSLGGGSFSIGSNTDD